MNKYNSKYTKKYKRYQDVSSFNAMIVILIVSAFLDRPILLNGNKGVYMLKCHSQTTLKWNKACVAELLVDSQKLVFCLTFQINYYLFYNFKNI